MSPKQPQRQQHCCGIGNHPPTKCQFILELLVKLVAKLGILLQYVSQEREQILKTDRIKAIFKPNNTLLRQTRLAITQMNSIFLASEVCQVSLQNWTFKNSQFVY